jgi:hypothetical protein
MSIGQLNYSIVTVDELRVYAPELSLSAYDNPTVSGMLIQSSQIVSDFLDYTPVIETITDEIQKGRISTRGDLTIYPAKIPVVSVSKLEFVRGSTSVELGLTNSGNVSRYNIDYQKRKIVYPYEEITLNGYPVFTDFYALKASDFYTRLTYRAGWEVEDIPGAIKQATINIMRELLSPKFNLAGATEVQQGGISLKFSDRKTESKFLRDARRLLAPYVR